MAKATGHVWSNEEALMGWISSREGASPAPSWFQREVSLAVQDTRCAYSTSQARSAAAAFVTAADHMPTDIEGGLLAAAALKDRAALQATKLLAP
jgi:hypothetical protein